MARYQVEVTVKRVNKDSPKDVSTTSQVYEDMSAASCLALQKAVAGAVFALADAKSSK